MLVDEDCRALVLPSGRSICITFIYAYGGLSLHPLEVAESLLAGSGEDWLCWRALNRLRTGVGRAKTVTRRWGYLNDAHSVDCDCGERQTIAHLLSRRLLYETCTADDLATVTDRAKACRPQVGENCAKDTTEEDIASTHKPVLARAPSSLNYN